ncbi:J domain-containing protein required for chloroplast accumulation response 1-like [Hibiscus syriacus]|uniref:J domain-containing protein required for chloroplast accumulation response 1-like n=1 Tax=Hibiscus syriacus TaxID=106335 RepID=UPI001920D466|nr:J domain-containing protein required for chloroplast accumulation response 1-like [Hibiscus syriacus]
MKSFSQRESILLGYSPPNTPDIDFNDVFGGPPRGSSAQETRHRFSGDTDSYSPSGFGSSDETSYCASRLSGLREKAVFGEEGRRQWRSDFYDDIFGGNESCSPSKYETKETFALSQARLPFSTSLPTRFRGMEVPTYGSPTPTRTTWRSKDGSSTHYASSPLSTFSNQQKVEPKNDFQSSYPLSALSHELSTANQVEDSINLTNHHQTEEMVNSVRGNGKLQENNRLQKCSSAKGWTSCENMATESISELDNSFRSTDRMSANAKSFRVERDDNATLSSRIHSRTEDRERVQFIREDDTPKSEPEIDVCDKQESETKKAHTKTLELLFHDDDHYQRGNDGVSKNYGTKDISEKSRKKLYEILDDENVKKPDTPNMEGSTRRVKGFPRNSGDNGKGRVRGKIKDFIKIFNQDATPKPKPDTVRETRDSRRPERHSIKPEYEPSDGVTDRVVKFRMPDKQEKKSSSQVIIASHMFKGAAEKETNTSVTDPVSNGFNTIIEDPTDSIDENFTIEDLTPEEKIFPDFGIDPEEIKAIDAKIQQWSSGKGGNIRSLLSTLQYVLWPNSGWKAVPLVDIIEGPAVKRSYQKALMCLHPDKLQQKGAASGIKYMAERVFDVLQDAWTHFNSLGSV